MAEFDTLQKDLRTARAAAESGERAWIAGREKARALGLRLEAVSRSHGEDSAARRRARAAHDEAVSAAQASRKEHDTRTARHRRLVEQFLPFSDPRTNIAKLPDSTPFLLLPVRLETRFKTFSPRGGAVRHELWVRVFPDQCSIDTFDELLSTSEVLRTRSYWASVWSAGTPAVPELAGVVRDRQLGAWRKLMGSFNAGRAHWLLTQIEPLNPGDIPVRSSESDVLAIIVVSGPPPAEKDAVASYWQSVLAAGGRPEEVALAFSAFVTATDLSEEAAQALLQAHAPDGLTSLLEAGVPEGEVKVTFLSLGDGASSKQNAWGHAARVRTFPERFVLLGFQGNDAPPTLTALGAPVPSPLVVGPSAEDDVEALLKEAFGEDVILGLSDEQKASKYVEYLAQHAETRWLFDFERAVEVGLGFRVPLTVEQASRGFSRLFVLGVQLSSDADGGKAALEELLMHHQLGDAGFSILRQGTPTNNTEETASGFSIKEDPEEAHARYFGQPEPPVAPDPALDGPRLARALGIDPYLARLTTAENFAHTDQLEARAMQTALWHGTLGYFLEAMVPAISSEEVRSLVRDHFLEHVRGRGAVPSVRIGKQPYGILTLSNLRNFRWISPPDSRPRLSRTKESVLSTIFQAAMIARDDLSDVTERVAHVGAGTDAHATLLSVLGLHPASVEYDRRIAESFLAMNNALLAQGWMGVDVEGLRTSYRNSGIDLLRHLGYQPTESAEPPRFPLFDQAFFQEQEDVGKPPVDDGPLSEQRRLGPCALDGGNYIEWLIQKARTDHAAIRNRTGFSPGKRPTSVLFDLLCHSLNLEFAEAGLRLLDKAKLLDPGERDALRIDQALIGVQAQKATVESKWDIVYRKEPTISEKTTVVEHISNLLAARSNESSVARTTEVLTALERLAQLPTARLERCLAEHVDACHYRLDAWLLSVVSAQLSSLRAQKDPNGGPRGGIYLGAYGWVEDLKPKPRQLAAVELDHEQQQIFDPQRQGVIVRDSSNAGYTQAPSLAHGLTAATLRNAYLSAASPADVERYKINLSSERVRLALGIIEGMQEGQGLAELLGYQLERGLHDHNTLNLDIFIYELRKVFPLASNKHSGTAIRKGRIPKNALEEVRFPEEIQDLALTRASTKVEARNVTNGLALLERVAVPGQTSYPFGFPTGTGPGELRSASEEERAAINAQVERLKNVRDAVADLALAESVHQTVQGNYERAAGVLDAFSKGAFPQLPDVVQSPASGLGLTHRFAVHFPAGVSPDVGTSPRSKAEPALNAWAKDLFPAPASVQCTVRFRPRPDPAAAPGAWSSFPVTLAALALEPIDLLYLHDAESEKNLNALDDHVLRVFRLAAPRRLDLEIEIDYSSAPAIGLSFFQLGALLRHLRTLVIAARPLEPTDLALQNEGTKAKNETSRVAPERIEKAADQLTIALAALSSDVVTPLSALVDPDDPSVGAAHVPEILAGIDALLEAFVLRLGPLSRFGFEGAGTAFVSERLRGLREAVCALVRTHGTRWAERSELYRVIVEDELPLATSEEQTIGLWHKAEAQVRTTFTSVFVDAADLGATVTSERTFFEQKRTAAADLVNQGFTGVAPLFGAAALLITGTEAVDLEPLDITPAVRAAVVLAEDLLRQATQLHARASKIATEVDALLLAAQTAPRGGLKPLEQAVKLLFGEGFRLFPEFSLAPEPALELAQCLAGQAQLLSHQTTVVGTDAPTEDWLYGVARVREKLAAWESSVVLAEGFTPRPPLELTPLQLPYRDGDSWLALAYPPDHAVTGDNLLYTAYAPNFDPAEPLVGALIDEWTETIPARQETAALTFHYDRPNCEAPQALLLVTPAAMTGHWQWGDLVASLHEALDLGRLRALEPDLIDDTRYAKLVPATVAAMSVRPVTMMVNFSLQQLATAEP